MAALEIRKLERRGSSPAELVELFTSKESGGVPPSRRNECLRQFLASYVNEEHSNGCFQSSDPHSVASLLVQQLLTHFSQTFLGRTPSALRSTSLDQTPTTSEPPSVEQTSLREFLCQDATLLLLVAIQIVGQQVDSTYPELADLLVVVLKTLLSKSCAFEVDKAAVQELVPFYHLILPEPPSIVNTTNIPSSSFLTASMETRTRTLCDVEDTGEEPQSKSSVAMEPQSKSSVAMEPQSKSSVAMEPQSKSSVAMEPQSKSSVAMEPQSKSSVAMETQSKSSVAMEPQSKSSVAMETQSKSSVAMEPQSKSSVAQSKSSVAMEPQSKSLVAMEPQSKSSVAMEPHSKSLVVMEPQSKSLVAMDTVKGQCKAIVPTTLIHQFLEALQGRQDLRSLISDRELHLLLLSVLENTAVWSGARGTSQVSSTLHLLQGITTLFEDVITLWLQAHNQSNSVREQDSVSSSSGVSGSSGVGWEDGLSDKEEGSPTSSLYNGVVHIARIVLRFWLVLASRLLHSPLSVQQLLEVKVLLFAPIATVSTACYNLQRSGIFRGNDCLDHEFTLIILETLFACLHNINLFALIPTCPVEDFFQVLRDCLTDGCNEWFTYLCSKLHGISEVGGTQPGLSNWASVMEHSHRLLIHILRELIVTSSHIQSFQKASKSALAGGRSLRPVIYSLEVATGFDKLTQRLCKMAQLLLDTFRAVPLIQLLSLQLLSETAKDTIGIIGNFLTNISDPSIWSNPEVLDLYLELLESIWFKLSPDYAGSPSWWKKLSNYSTLLLEAKREIKCQAIYHIQCLLSHDSTMLKSQLSRYVILPFHAHLMSQVKKKCYGSLSKDPPPLSPLRVGKESPVVNPEIVLSDDKRMEVSLFLRLLLKVAANPHSLEPFLAESPQLYSLLLLLPFPQFRRGSLAVVEECIMTLRKLAQTQQVQAQTRVPVETLDSESIQRVLLQILLSIAFTVQAERIPYLCLTVSVGKPPLQTYGIGEVDQVHQMVQNTFENIALKQLITPSFVSHLAVVADVWNLLAKLAAKDNLTFLVLRNNHVWDVIQFFAPLLGSFLSRVQQRIREDLAELESDVKSLQETVVSLLTHLLALTHLLCWQKRDLKVLEIHCHEVQNSLMGGQVCSITNGHQYCTALLKASCCSWQQNQKQPDVNSPPPSSSSSSAVTPGSSTKQRLTDSGSKESGRRSQRDRRKESSMSFTSPLTHTSSLPNSFRSWSILSSNSHRWSLEDGPSSFRSWVIISMSDSELSGYEGDVEQGTCHGTELGESCDEAVEEGQLLQSMTTYFVPVEVQQRLWTTLPLLHCIRLLQESMREGITANCEKCVEVFLYQLYAMMKADPYNVTLLSGKSLLETLLDAFAALFESTSEKSITCCRLICRIAEVLGSFQISSSETKKLFLRLQRNRVHLERLPQLLHTVALSSSQSNQPSSFIEFTYNRPLQRLDTRQMLTAPYVMPWGTKPRCVSVWFCVSKYCLQAFMHLLSVYTGEVFLQVWVCAISGDVIISLRPELQLDLHSTTEGSSSETFTLGSIITLGKWHHLAINILPCNMQPTYEIVVVADGGIVGTFRTTIHLPRPTFSSSSSWMHSTQYYIAGGAISAHTAEHHFKLVNAEHMQLSWRLGSLQVLHGFQNPSMASVLYQLGPDCASSHQQAVEAVVSRSGFGISVDAAKDTSVISTPPISSEEIQLLLQTPILAYSAHDPHKVFMISQQLVREDDHPIEVLHTHELQWVLSANAVGRPQLLDVVHSALGVEHLVYLYAKVVGESCSEEVQCHVLSLLCLAVQHSVLVALEFEQLGGVRLLQQLLRTPQAAVGKRTVDVFLSWCCGVERCQVKDVDLLEHILLDWHIWDRAAPGVWEYLLWQLEQLLKPPEVVNKECPNRENYNIKCFLKAGAIVRILLTSKERSSESLPSLPPTIACQFVRLVECLMGSPPRIDCLKYVCDHLLVSDLNDVKYVAAASAMETSVSVFEGRRASTPQSAPNHAQPLASAGSTSDVSQPFSPGSSIAHPVMVLPNSVDGEAEEVITFDVQPGEGRLPDSSYTEEDSLFTWTDITGQLAIMDSDASEKIPESMEVGMLGLVRKLIMLMPDNMVRRVVGQIVQHESLIAIANDHNIVVRTAVVRVLDEYFKRGGEGVRVTFVQVKGFNLLAGQLKQYVVSFELMSALCSIVVGQDVNLKGEQPAPLRIPNVISGFQMHAVIPVIQCIVNAIGQPQLCHTSLCILRELFESVRGMPTFMLNNGLLKLICQLIAIATDYTPLSRDDKELILTDVLHFCKLVVIFAISSDQEDMFRMLENLLVCLRHCCEEIKKAKGSHCVSVVYLHQFQYHVLTQALRYFHEDIQEGGAYVPTLPSGSQPPGHSDLTTRFTATCINAVDWSVYGVETYTAEHAQYFKKGVSMATGMVYNPQAKVAPFDAAFLRFLLRYFHKALLPKNSRGGTLTLDPQRYSMSSRSQLAEQLARLLGHVISPIHDASMRCAVLKEIWDMEGDRAVFNLTLNSTLKKLLSSRLVLTVIHLMRQGAHMDSTLLNILNELFQVACRSGVTRLKTSTKLSSLLACEEEVDSRKKHKYEGILEEMRSVDQRWVERYEFDLKGFAQRQRNLYGRLVEKARHRQLAIDRASASVTQRIFEQQSLLRRNFLEQISQAGMHERDTLRQWRRVIIINTHPRALWSRDEGRVMMWQLDPTEGPGRVRRRMMRAPRTVDERHLLPDARTSSERDGASTPLSFIFENSPYHGDEALHKKIVLQGEEMCISGQTWQCSNICPDNCCDGNLIISNMCCYFVGDKALEDPNMTKVLPWDEETTLLSWGHSEVVEIHRRRYMLKNNALEIFLINGKTMLLAFKSTKERNGFHTELLQLELPNLVDSGEAESEKLKQVTASWRQGEITNFEYLMELNKLAGRTFNDLMQYPVFPFILADYESAELDLRRADTFRRFALPISIQDDSKLPKYLDTYRFLAAESRTDSMAPGLPTKSSKPYHYGSHYSNSGIVFHFLVRLPPFTDMFLTFQGRNFDIADRTFRNLATTWWLSSSESTTDVKELIPEFFFLPEFLVNAERFNFGVCQNGDRVDHVCLPPWARNQPRLFILRHRQALESDFVSQHLHEWIDLVFGYKQTGKAAVQAVNVFHPATYYGADGIDIDSVGDSTQQAAMRTMVKTYGQMPLQLFREPHLPRSKSPVLTTFRMRIGSALRRFTSTSSLSKAISPYFWMHITHHRVRLGLSGSDCDFLGHPTSPELLLVHSSIVDRTPEKMVCVGNGELVITELNASFFQNSSPAHSSLLVTWGKWDNSLIVRSTMQEGTSLRLHSHPLNRVMCCECVCSGQMIVSGGVAGVVSFWQITNTPQRLHHVGGVTHLRGHDGPITCLAACKPFSIVVTGSSDKTCIIWDTNRLCYVNSLTGHEGPVSVIATSPTLGDIATVCTCKTTKQSKYSCVLRVWTINGKEVGSVSMEVQIYCLSYTAAPEGVYVNVLVGGLANGNIRIWSSWDVSLLREIHCPLESSIPILSIAISSCSKELYAGYSNQQVVAWVKPKHNTNHEEADFVDLGMETYYLHKLGRV